MAAEAMRRWYTEVGTKWLRRRIRPWAARMGEESVTVESATSASAGAPPALIQAPSTSTSTGPPSNSPPSLIDYVLVHELAHLRERNHTSRVLVHRRPAHARLPDPTRPPSPSSASTSGLAKAVDGQGRAARTAGVRASGGDSGTTVGANPSDHFQQLVVIARQIAPVYRLVMRDPVPEEVETLDMRSCYVSPNPLRVLRGRWV